MTPGWGGPIDSSIPKKYHKYKDDVITFRYPGERSIRGIVFVEVSDTTLSFREQARMQRNLEVTALSCPPSSIIKEKGRSPKFMDIKQVKGHLDIDEAWKVIDSEGYDQEYLLRSQ